ncbi:immunoglobulin-like domain-containing protein [Rummeliibacillus suwonensis]|uniref:immunoglobulin-like domain-containing protein n=1 Tax=Rummeliibacillus suwonensis TaxID=1306154 RepID=UPI0028A287B3|nr:immunoglobulin-like domain-containing protein [Rummeliibacillus suwonensis]
MTNYKMKFVKSAAALALGASVITTAVAAGDVSASAKTTYKVSNGKLVNAKTKKAIKGYKFYKSVLYKDGKKLTGTYKGKYYKSGKLFTGTTSYGNYYKSGVKFTGKKGNVYYKNGKKFTGTTSYGYYYKNGVRFTGKTSSGIYYKNGKKFTGTTSYGYYYINGKRAEGIVVVKGVDVLYKNGKVVADKTAPVITIDGQKNGDQIELENSAEFATPKASVKDNVDSKVKVVTEIKDQDGKVVDAIDTKVAGTYTITYAAKDASGNTSAVTITVVVGEADLAVNSVKTVNPTTAVVEFNQKLDSIDKNAFTVANKATGEKQVVKAVQLSDDKKSATVEFYNVLSANTTYSVDVKVADATLPSELVIGSLVPASIEVTDQTVANDVDTAFKYKALDENGVDVTSLYQVPNAKVSFVSASNSIDPSTGVIHLASGSTIKAKVVIKDGDKVLAESKEVSITAEAVKPTSISAWTVFTGATPNYDQASDEVYTDGSYKIAAQVKDQLGSEITSGFTLNYKSQNTDVAVVDKTTGAINVLANGTVPVEISVLGTDGKVLFTKIVEVKVKTAKAVDTVSLDQSSVLLSNVEGDAKTVTVNVKDQYGNAFEHTPSVVVKDATGKDVTPTEGITATPVVDKTGEYTFSLPTQTTAGNYTVEVTAGEKTATLALTVKAPGAYSKYDVVNIPTTVDLNTANSSSLTFTPAVNKVDAEGLKIEDENNYTVEVSGLNAATVSGKTITVAPTEANPVKVGDKFTITVKVGEIAIDTQTVSVVDTTVADTADFTSYSLSANKDNADSFKTALAAVTQLNGAKVSEGITTVKLVSTDSTVVDADGAVKGAGTAKVFIQSITADGKTITFQTPVKMTVTVAE